MLNLRMVLFDTATNCPLWAFLYLFNDNGMQSVSCQSVLLSHDHRNETCPLQTVEGC